MGFGPDSQHRSGLCTAAARWQSHRVSACHTGWNICPTGLNNDSSAACWQAAHTLSRVCSSFQNHIWWITQKRVNSETAKGREEYYGCAAKASVIKRSIIICFSWSSVWLLPQQFVVCFHWLDFNLAGTSSSSSVIHTVRKAPSEDDFWLQLQLLKCVCHLATLHFPWITGRCSIYKEGKKNTILNECWHKIWEDYRHCHKTHEPSGKRSFHESDRFYSLYEELQPSTPHWTFSPLLNDTYRTCVHCMLG